MDVAVEGSRGSFPLFFLFRKRKKTGADIFPGDIGRQKVA